MSAVPTRRTFLSRSSVALASAVGGLPLAGRAGPLEGRLRLAVKYHMVDADLSVVDKFKLLKDVGFDGVEYRRRDGVEPRTLRKARDAADLPIHGVVNGSNPDVAGAVELAKDLGAGSVLYVAGRVNGNRSYEKNYKQTQAILRKALPTAEAAGVDVLVENVWNNFLLSPLEMRRYVDELDSPAVGVYFDIGNIVRVGWPEQWIRILGDRIGKLDVKEYSREKQRKEGLYAGFDAKLGEGSVDWAAVRQALVDIGYKGWATKERGSGGRAYLGNLLRRMERVLDI